MSTGYCTVGYSKHMYVLLKLLRAFESVFNGVLELDCFCCLSADSAGEG